MDAHEAGIEGVVSHFLSAVVSGLNSSDDYSSIVQPLLRLEPDQFEGFVVALWAADEEAFLQVYEWLSKLVDVCVFDGVENGAERAMMINLLHATFQAVIQRLPADKRELSGPVLKKLRKAKEEIAKEHLHLPEGAPGDVDVLITSVPEETLKNIDRDMDILDAQGEYILEESNPSTPEREGLIRMGEVDAARQSRDRTRAEQKLQEEVKATRTRARRKRKKKLKAAKAKAFDMMAKSQPNDDQPPARMGPDESAAHEEEAGAAPSESRWFNGPGEAPADSIESPPTAEEGQEENAFRDPATYTTAEWWLADESVCISTKTKGKGSAEAAVPLEWMGKPTKQALYLKLLCQEWPGNVTLPKAIQAVFPDELALLNSGGAEQGTEDSEKVDVIGNRVRNHGYELRKTLNKKGVDGDIIPILSASTLSKKSSQEMREVSICSAQRKTDSVRFSLGTTVV